MNEFVVAAAQQRVIEDMETNKSKALSLVKRAIQVDAKIVVLPEVSNTGFFPENYEKVGTAEEELDLILKLSEKRDILIIAGIAEKENGKLYNTVAFIYKGEILDKYRKVLLFPLTDERKYFTSGKEFKVLDTPYGKIGALICYEVRFPEIARKLTKMGAEILAILAEFPSNRIEHWKILTRARAIENQVFVIATNCVDFEKNYNGYSAIIDPFGKILSEGGELQELIFSKINLDILKDYRKVYPYLEDLNKLEKII